MTRSILFAAAIAFAARSAYAQGPLSASKAAAQKAANAASAHVEAEQRPDVQPVASPKPSKPSKPSRVAARPKQEPTVEHAGGHLDVSASDTDAMTTVIMREQYAYAKDGRRDPFFSLMSTTELRPTMSDLRLTGILFDPNGHSVATLRDIGTNTQYRVATGSVLGRMRVSSIRLKTVVFTIDEFGMNRQDSLVLGDSTKVRAK
ncbi:MAG TPA: hypothetical protein VFS57_09255 [Gemmatimonadaceae bacterium]|nr:hypothetical protein [Gemmatimonadaceae bacterium]